MPHICIDILIGYKFDIFGWGDRKVPMMKNLYPALTTIRVISLDRSVCEGIFNKTINASYYVCAKTIHNHQKLDKVILIVNFIIQ